MHTNFNQLKYLGALAGIGLFLCYVPAPAAATDEAPPVPKMRKNDVTPLPDFKKPVSAHAPFQDGDCSICHQRKDHNDPGPILKQVNLLCLDCHDDFSKVLARKSVHEPARINCVSCHSPHNSMYPHLLVEDSGTLCLSCHTSISNLVANAAVKHDALTTGAKCVNCHNPHGANVQHLLNKLPYDLCVGCHGVDGVKDHDGKTLTNMKQLLADNLHQHGPVESKDCSACHLPHGGDHFRLLTKDYPATFYSPYDLCVGCHGQDGVKDHDGKTLTNMKQLLADNPQHHGPVESKDCSACHLPHGGDHFRLLTKEYPATFYSPYDPKLYDLCFDCHEESMVKEPKTTSLTRFRNGDQNLHYVHVNKDERGRTCRACHEVHASKQPHQIRDAVPYGHTGYMLKVNFTKTDTGGQCAETCHVTRSYTNVVVHLVPPTVVATNAPAK